MSSEADAARALQEDLDREQASANLDQGISDRDQNRADREQEPLDAAHQALAAERDGELPGTPDRPEREAALALAQERATVRQSQLDETQHGQHERQNLLDEQQEQLDSPDEPCSRDLEAARTRATESLEDALHQRAADTLERAEDERSRAADALARVDAAQRRRRAAH